MFYLCLSRQYRRFEAVTRCLSYLKSGTEFQPFLNVFFWLDIRIVFVWLFFFFSTGYLLVKGNIVGCICQHLIFWLNDPQLLLLMFWGGSRLVLVSYVWDKVLHHLVFKPKDKDAEKRKWSISSQYLFWNWFMEIKVAFCM